MLPIVKLKDNLINDCGDKQSISIIFYILFSTKSVFGEISNYGFGGNRFAQEVNKRHKWKHKKAM